MIPKGYESIQKRRGSQERRRQLRSRNHRLAAPRLRRHMRTSGTRHAQASQLPRSRAHDSARCERCGQRHWSQPTKSQSDRRVSRTRRPVKHRPRPAPGISAAPNADSASVAIAASTCCRIDRVTPRTTEQSRRMWPTVAAASRPPGSRTHRRPHQRSPLSPPSTNRSPRLRRS